MLPIDRLCPECAFPVGESVRQWVVRRDRPLSRIWARIALTTAVLGLVLMIGFHVALMINHLDLRDLWYGARSNPTPTAIIFARAGIRWATLLFFLALTGLAYSFCVLVFALARYDRGSILRCGVAVIITLFYGYMAANCGFYIAGI